MRNEEFLKIIETMSVAQLKALDKDTRDKYIVQYVLATHATVRATGRKFGVCKSTVWRVCNEYIQHGNAKLAKELRSIFDHHIETRHLHGGNATKHRWNKINAG